MAGRRRRKADPGMLSGYPDHSAQAEVKRRQSKEEKEKSLGAVAVGEIYTAINKEKEDLLPVLFLLRNILQDFLLKKLLG